MSASSIISTSKDYTRRKLITEPLKGKLPRLENTTFHFCRSSKIRNQSECVTNFLGHELVSQQRPFFGVQNQAASSWSSRTHKDKTVTAARWLSSVECHQAACFREKQTFLRHDLGWLLDSNFFFLSAQQSLASWGDHKEWSNSVWQQVWAGKYVTFQLRLLTRLYLRHYSEFEIISITDSSFFLMIELTWQKREDALFQFSRLLITSSRDSIPLVVQVKIEVQNGDFSSRGRAHPHATWGLSSKGAPGTTLVFYWSEHS